MPALITGGSILKADRAAKCVRMTLAEGAKKSDKGRKNQTIAQSNSGWVTRGRASLGHASKKPFSVLRFLTGAHKTFHQRAIASRIERCGTFQGHMNLVCFRWAPPPI